jgi:hypothetical protein
MLLELSVASSRQKKMKKITYKSFNISIGKSSQVFHSEQSNQLRYESPSMVTSHPTLSGILSSPSKTAQTVVSVLNAIVNSVATNRLNNNEKFTVLQLVLSWTKDNFNAAMTKRAAYPEYDNLVCKLLRAEADPVLSKCIDIPMANKFPSDFSYPHARVNAVRLQYKINELNRTLSLAEADPEKYCDILKSYEFPLDYPYPIARVNAVWLQYIEKEPQRLSKYLRDCSDDRIAVYFNYKFTESDIRFKKVE